MVKEGKGIFLRPRFLKVFNLSDYLIITAVVKRPEEEYTLHNVCLRLEISLKLKYSRNEWKEETVPLRETVGVAFPDEATVTQRGIRLIRFFPSLPMLIQLWLGANMF